VSVVRFRNGRYATPTFSHLIACFLPFLLKRGAPVRSALQAGDVGMHKIAAAFGVGAGTVQRIEAEMPA
jgi:hypothetical protein